MTKITIIENFENNKIIITNKTNKNIIATCGAPYIGNFEDADINGNKIKHKERIFIKNKKITEHEFSEKKLIYNLNLLGNKPLIVGGHYMPNPNNMDIMGINPMRTLKLSLEIIKELKLMNKEPTLLIYINDIHLPENLRKKLYMDYKIPSNALELINQTQSEVGEFEILIVSEEYLYTHVRGKKKKVNLENVDLTGIPCYTANKNWFNPNDSKIRLYQNPTIPTENRTNKCTIATAGLIKLLVNLRNTGMLIFVPICGFNGELGLRLGETIFQSEKPRITVMTTETCF